MLYDVIVILGVTSIECYKIENYNFECKYRLRKVLRFIFWVFLFFLEIEGIVGIVVKICKKRKIRILVRVREGRLK